MTEPLRIAAPVARRYLVLRHLLAPPRSLPPGPDSVMTVFDRLGSIQFDPIDVTGRNHDLVLLARIDGYRREHTEQLLYAERRLYETYNKGLSLVPTAELPWYRLTWDAFAAGDHARTTFETHRELVEELLGRIRESGPLSSIHVEPRDAIDWYWRPTNQVRAVLEALAQAGVLGLARREGNRRVYDLAERLFPPELLSRRLPEREQRRHRLRSRFQAHGLLPGGGGQGELWVGTGAAELRRELHRELVESGSLVPVAIDGLTSVRYAPCEDLAILEQAEREVAAGTDPGGHGPGVAFLAPLDPLVWDRGLLRSLLGFDYVWEVYVPAAKRRWGYYVLPVLYGDRLVGRIEPRFERRAGVLRVLDVWWEAGFDPLAPADEGQFLEAIAAAIRAHLAFGGARRVAFPRAARHRAFVRAMRERLG
ncbi:MAG TPA: crosslink repair DNA glycosylase YcaQ family protein [Candidatus Limnocylindrales bacterium]|nr:crosslink repair DNA glycosylase YcaQ family protein [Candidatus Limnocylindrales bacterium]